MFEQWMKQFQSYAPAQLDGQVKSMQQESQKKLTQFVEDVQTLTALQMGQVGRALSVRKPEDLSSHLTKTVQENQEYLSSQWMRMVDETQKTMQLVNEQVQSQASGLSTQAEKFVSSGFNVAKQVIDTVEESTQSAMKKGSAKAKK